MSHTAEIYTREDGSEVLDFSAQDWNDGSTIRAALNSGHPEMQHIHLPAIFGGHLAAATEFRFLDQHPTDWEFWGDEKSFCINHANMIANAMGLPLLKG
jgi:hypothetical protein